MNWAAKAGIVTGYSDTVFGPDDNVTREQLATILFRCDMGGLDYAALEAFLGGLLSSLGDISMEDMMGGQASLPFEDAGTVSEWAEDGVKWAWENGVVTGKTDTHLAPKDNAARAEVATMLLRMTAISDE